MSTRWFSVGITVLGLAGGGCSMTNQINADLQYRQLVEGDVHFGQEGVGVLTPSAPTGQESDRQALADALGEILDRDITDANVVPLPALLSAVNQAGLARAYSGMYAEYDRTGILERDVLRDIGDAAGVRYLAKLNLGDFAQSTSGRARILGVRFLDTRTASIRVHLEIWDTYSGAIAWQGNEELTFAQEKVREAPITFQHVAAMAAERLVAKVGDSGRERLEEENPALAHAGPMLSPVSGCSEVAVAVEPVALTNASVSPAAFQGSC